MEKPEISPPASKPVMDKPEISSPDPKKLKTEHRPSYVEPVLDAKRTVFPNMARFLYDPVSKEIAKKVVEDPAYKQILEQLQLLYSAPTEFDAHAYYNAVQQVSENPQLTANAKHIADAWEPGPCLTDEQSARIKAAFAYNDAPDENRTLDLHGSAKLRMLGNRDILLKVVDALTLSIDGDALKPYDVSSLHHMASVGDTKGLKKALDSGAGVNEVDLVRRTALHVACTFGKAQCAYYLIKYGVNVDAIDTKMNTALHYAALGGKKKCVKRLLCGGVNKDIKNFKGYTPFEMAVIQKKDEVVKLLDKDEVHVCHLCPRV